MRLSDFITSYIAIDLGTANTLIINKNRIVVDEPSIIALDRRTGQVLARANAREDQWPHQNHPSATRRSDR